MPGEGFYRVTVVSSMYAQQLNNVLNFLGPAADPGALSTLANEVDTIWIDRVKTLQSAAVVYNGIKVRALNTTLPVFTKTINKPGTPGFDNQLDPCQTFILRLRTGFAGKHGRGRCYISGVLKGWFENGLVTAAIITSWNNVFSQILGSTGFGSSPYQLCVGDKAATVFRPVTSMQVAPTLGHQRRRNIGVGI